MRLSFRNNDFEIDQATNLTIYAALTSDAQSQPDDKIIQFYLTHKENLFSQELIEFLKLSGVDWTKENELFHYPINNLEIVEGWYDIVGHLLSKDKLGFYWEGGPDGLYTTNLYFGVDNFGIRDEFKNFETFRIDFAIVLPSQMLGNLH